VRPPSAVAKIPSRQSALPRGTSLIAMRRPYRVGVIGPLQEMLGNVVNQQASQEYQQQDQNYR
jgi:hypothetical protein